jgi:arsenate reductase (thioredoxin)
MAEGWTRQLLSHMIDAYSAGVEPHGVDPRAIQVMAEAGVDISGQTSKHVDTLQGIELDYVITLCDQANESCPFFPGKTRRLHVGFDDPPRLSAESPNEEAALQHYRRVRDEINAFVARLLEVLEGEQ